jgi:hypothetical protein
MAVARKRHPGMGTLRPLDQESADFEVASRTPVYGPCGRLGKPGLLKVWNCLELADQTGVCVGFLLLSRRQSSCGRRAGAGRPTAVNQTPQSGRLNVAAGRLSLPATAHEASVTVRLRRGCRDGVRTYRCKYRKNDQSLNHRYTLLISSRPPLCQS